MPPKEIPGATPPINKNNRINRAEALAAAKERLKKKKQTFEQEYFPSIKDTNKGAQAGYNAAYHGHKKKIRTDKSALYQRAYNQGYDDVCARLTPEQRDTNRGRLNGHRAAYQGYEKKTNADKSPAYQQAYNQGYDDEYTNLTPEQRDSNRGRLAGKQAAYQGNEKKIKADESPAYQQAYNQGYDAESTKLKNVVCATLCFFSSLGNTTREITTLTEHPTRPMNEFFSPK